MVSTINEILKPAEHQYTKGFLFNIANILLLGLLNLFVPNTLEAPIAAAEAFIKEQNAQVFNPVGLNICSIKETALLHVWDCLIGCDSL